MRFRIVQTGEYKFIVQRRFLGFLWLSDLRRYYAYDTYSVGAIVFPSLDDAAAYIEEERLKKLEQQRERVAHRAGLYPKVVKDPA